jgi:hypothetical protein
MKQSDLRLLNGNLLLDFSVVQVESINFNLRRSNTQEYKIRHEVPEENLGHDAQGCPLRMLLCRFINLVGPSERIVGNYIGIPQK